MKGVGIFLFCWFGMEWPLDMLDSIDYIDKLDSIDRLDTVV